MDSRFYERVMIFKYLIFWYKYNVYKTINFKFCSNFQFDESLILDRFHEYTHLKLTFRKLG